MKDRAITLYNEIKLLDEEEDAKLLCLVTPESGGNSSREHAIDTSYEGNFMAVGMLRDRAKRHVKTSMCVVAEDKDEGVPKTYRLLG